MPRTRSICRLQISQRNQRSRSRKLRLEELESVVAPATLWVTNTGDNGGVDPSPGQGTGTLRQAILDASFYAGGPHTIKFSIAGGGAHVIAPASRLPALGQRMVIDGTSQLLPGGLPAIVISGEFAGSEVNGLSILPWSGGSSIRSLCICKFSGWGIFVAGANNEIRWNCIGTDPTGTVAQGNGKGGIGLYQGLGANGIYSNTISGNNGPGVYISGATSIDEQTIYYSDYNVLANNIIGLTSDGQHALGNAGVGVFLDNYVRYTKIGTDTSFIPGNTISANAYQGIYMQGSGTSNNVVTANKIGLDKYGTKALGNGNNGIWLAQGTHDNIIGRDDTGGYESNYIGGNTFSGIFLSGTGTSRNVIASNYIGLGAYGDAIGNGQNGVSIFDGATNNRIGTNGNGNLDDWETNIIGANAGHGVHIAGSGADGNTVAGNLIGTNYSGDDLGNVQNGIAVWNGAKNNRIGSTGSHSGAANERNLIVNSGWSGVVLADPGTTGNVVAGNHIGADKTGKIAQANGDAGVLIFAGAQSNTIGTNGDGVGDSLERNIISGNVGLGVGIFNSGTYLNVVAGNYIGTDITGAATLANGYSGISIWNQAKNNRIGTNGDGAGDLAERNIISGNRENGVAISGSGTNANVVAGNFIGTEVNGILKLPNGYSGVAISGQAQSNRIGTGGTASNAAGERNLISGNADRGVTISGTGTNQNIVAGNLIGSDVSGALALGNTGEGVAIFSGAQGNRIGTNGDGSGDILERNIVSANVKHGIVIAGAGANQNIVAGNYVGTNATGNAKLANAWSGIGIGGGAQGNRIGVNGGDANAAAEGNLISGNVGAGIFVESANTNSNIVAGNLIGTNAAGTAALGNGYQGVFILAGASNNRVGTDGDGVGDIFERNVISASAANGVAIAGNGTNGNVVAGNYIGTDVNGTAKLANKFSGVAIWDQAKDNRIGTAGTAANVIGESNLISGNGDRGVWISGTGTNQNVVAGNYIGVDATGNAALGNATEGIAILNGAQSNRIGTNGDGTSDTAERNIISGNGANSFNGISIWDAGTNQNVVAGNYVGTNASGTAAIKNGFAGIGVAGGAQGNRIGVNGADSNAAAEGNLVSGNSTFGVYFYQAGTNANVLAGNLIGVDASGNAALPNLNAGVWVLSGATGNRIGTDGDGAGDVLERNVISGNLYYGIAVDSANDTVIAGNYVGTNSAGTAAIGNEWWGIAVYNGSSNTVIGTNSDGVNDSAEGNVVSGNKQVGIGVVNSTTTGSRIAGNTVGLDAGGTAAIGNAFQGVYVTAASNTTIGGSTAAARNVISANGNNGIWITGAKDTIVQGNYVGTDATGVSDFGNTFNGINVSGGSTNTTIGGITAETRNVISGNELRGVYIGDATTTNTVVIGNFIGTSATGLSAIPNTLDGVHIGGGSKANRIGTDADGMNDSAEGNLISGNSAVGVLITGTGTTSNLVAGNRIGVAATGMLAIPNQIGVRIEAGASNNTIGMPAFDSPVATRNVISGNLGNGVTIVGNDSAGNAIRGNAIFNNGGLGIDLGDDGVTANDPGDADTGPGLLQNSPILTHARAGAVTKVLGTLNSTPDSTFRIYFYAGADSSGYGERLLGSRVVTTDEFGNADFTVTDLGPSTDGEVIAATAEDAAGNTSEFSEALLFDNDGPIVTIDQSPSQADPTNGTTITFDVHFNEPAFEFDADDIELSASTVGGDLVATVSGSGTDYTVTVTGMDGDGDVVVSIPANAAEDILGNLSSASTSDDNKVRFDNVKPSVTIDQEASQSDPTQSGPISFHVVFSEPVFDFTGSDIDFTGSTVGGTLSASVLGSGTDYTVTVTGMFGYGTVVANIFADAAVDEAGNASTASTHTDNSVTYDGIGTVGLITAEHLTTEGSKVTVTVRRSGPGDGALSVEFAFTDDPANTGSDFVDPNSSHTLTWAHGEIGDKIFKVNIAKDSVSEGTETLNVVLSNLVGLDHPGLLVSKIVIAPSDPVAPGVYTDSDGDQVTLRLNGKVGTADVYLTNGKGPIQWIELKDTDQAKSSLTIAVKKPKGGTGDGRVSVMSITGSGLKSLNAPTTQLNGNGIRLNGYLGALTLHDIKNGADIFSDNGGNLKQTSRLKLGAIEGDTTIQFANPIKSLSAVGFGGGSIMAPSAGTIAINGRRANPKKGEAADAGDFKATVNLTGAGVAAGKAVLGSLKVKGNILNSVIGVGGKVNQVSALSFRDSRLFAGFVGDLDGVGAYNAAGLIASFRMTSKTDAFQNSHVIASSIGSVTLRSLDETNATPFGLIADNQIKLVQVGAPPIFSYRPKDGVKKSQGQFEVRIV